MSVAAARGMKQHRPASARCAARCGRAQRAPCVRTCAPTSPCVRTVVPMSWSVLISASSPVSRGRPRGPGTSVWARTRRACGRPSAGHEDGDVLASVVHRDGVATISGKIVDARDQVRIIRFSPLAFIASIRPISRSSTKAPSWSYDCISALLLTAAPAADDQVVGILVLPARPLAERGDAHGVTGWRPPFDLPSPAVRVVDGFMAEPRTVGAFRAICSYRPCRWTGSMVGVADLADSRAAGEEHAAKLAGRQAQHGMRAVLRDQLNRRPRGPRHARTLAGPELDAVDERAGRDVGERERVPGLMSASGPDSTVEPTRRRAGARMYAFAPSA